MPVSRKRKKKGKAVKPHGTIRVDPNKESSITLQDLINVVAYQEIIQDGEVGTKPEIVDEEKADG